MTAREVKTSLAKAARRCWPNVKKASDLPFPDYWKAVAEWLTFHAPRVGDALMWKLIDDFAVSAKEAEERGEAPTPPKVPERVREIWRMADKPEIPEKPVEHAQKPAAPTRPAAPARPADPMKQGRLL